MKPPRSCVWTGRIATPAPDLLGAPATTEPFTRTGPHVRNRPIVPASSAQLQRLRSLGHLLDDSIRIPGTGRRIGIDALLGLIPGIGDATGTVLSAYIILASARLGAPAATLVRMAGNVALEMVVGTVPLLGDLFDAGWKANLRNLRLLEAQLASPATTARASRSWLLVVAVGLVVVLVGIAALAFWLLWALARGLGL